jgi:hypothetical protein
LTALIKTLNKVSMLKRNQVEQAISSLLEPGLREPSPSLKTRIKRLFETDRALSSNPRSNDPEKANYAFFRDAAPGSGVEIWYSEYEAFALLLGLQLMSHNWPQRFVVSVLRRIRIPLEKEHKRILELDPTVLFDEKAIKRNAMPGSVAYPTTAPAFLAIASNYEILGTRDTVPFYCSVHPDLDSATTWIGQINREFGGGGSMFELTIAAHKLAKALSATQPQGRGPAG